MIKISNLTKKYNNQGHQIVALSGINLKINMGEFISFIGPSGYGKTTVLKIIGGLTLPSHGNIQFDYPNKPRVGFVFQDPNLFPWRTVKQNINLPLEIKKQKNDQLTKQLLDLVDLAQFTDNLPASLSCGMKQRINLARSLITQPQILLMDEPFSALDEITRDKLNIKFLSIWQQLQFTCLFVTHSVQEAVFLSDKVIVLSKRPARIEKIIDIELKRPRDLLIKDTSEFTNYTKCLRQILSKN